MDRRPLRTLIVTALTLAASATSCNRTSKDRAPAPPAATSSGSQAPVGASSGAASGSVLQAPLGASSDAHADCRPTGPPPAPPPGASATALRADFRARLTTLRVSAYEGAVILRKRDSSWATAGDGGCTVPAPRMERALDNLARLKASKTEEKPADGRAFELQIVALMGEEIALQLEVAGHGNTGDLVQLYDDSRVRLRGLDRTLWSPRPADWCKEL